MRIGSKLLVLLSLFALVALLPAHAQAAGDRDSAKLSKDSEFFQVINSSEVEFYPGVVFEVVKTAEGRVLARFGYSPEDASSAVAPAIECRCLVPSVCVENSCQITGTGTGNAKCRGGCYEANGEACVSCRFLDPLPQQP